jgi:hypothetical protein
MKTEIETELESLNGVRLLSAGRSGAELQLQFAEPHDGPAGGNGTGADAVHALHVSCTWRITSADGILTGSGDYFTPADPDADPDGFDWEEPGGNWCDVRLAALMSAIAAEPPAVTSIAADEVGGVVLSLSGDLTLVVFPESSHAEHVESEFWRFVRHGDGSPHFVVSSAGIDRQA